MNDSGLRWQARIGSLRGLAGILLVVLALILIYLLTELPSALKNDSDPQKVLIRELVDGSVGKEAFVTFTGTALYEAGYEETEDGRTVATYSPIIDDSTGHVIFIKDATAVLSAFDPQFVTITGMTKGTPSDLRDLIEIDLPDMESFGLASTSRLYVVEGESPPNPNFILLGIVTVLAAALVCLAPFFFPSIVFKPQPVDPTLAAAGPAGQELVVQATGKFLKLKQVRPSIVIGKGSRKFNNATANAIPLEQGKLMIYIHHVVRTKLYGVVTISKQENDWGLFISKEDAVEIDSGKILGWQDKLAVRFRLPGKNNKPEWLYLRFTKPAAQAIFVELLKKIGFEVSSGLGLYR